MSFLVFLACCATIAGAAAEFDIAAHLNTKTPYPAPLFLIAESTKKSINGSITSDFQVQDDCPASAVHVEYVARHGSREPTGGDVWKMEKLQDLLAKPDVQSSIQNPAFYWLRDWRSPYSDASAGLLTDVGELEHYNISRRWAAGVAYKITTEQTYFSWRFPIRTTEVSRAARSGNAFGYGLFGQDRGVVGPHKYNAFFTYSASADEDIELRFFDNCPRYTKDVIDNTELKVQQKAFLKQNGDRMAKAIGLRLNLSSNASWLDETVASYFWRGCAFDVSIYDMRTKFCALFDESTALAFEFADDLSTYYMKGWGTPLAYQIACPLVKSVFDGLKVAGSAVPAQPSANMRFAHAETILPFAARLGLFEDDSPLLASWSTEQQAARKWRSSVIAPFAANFAFLLYNCSTGLKVELRRNELPIMWPSWLGCPAHSSKCDLATLEKAFKSVLECPFEKLCAVPTPPPAPSAHSSSSMSGSGARGVSVSATVVIALLMFLLGAAAAIVILKVISRPREGGTYQRVSADLNDE